VLTEQVEYTNGSNEEEEFEVYDVSPCVTVDHEGLEKFKKHVKVSFPLPEHRVHLDTFVVLLQWKHDDEIELQEHDIVIRDGVGIVEVDSFSRKMLARVKKGPIKNFSARKNDVKRQVRYRLGLRTYCQILIFVDTAEVNTLWVEVVSSNKVKDVLNKRKKDNPCLFEMNNSRSREICLADRQGVRISIEGKLRFVPRYMDGYAVLTFRRNSMENHIRFPLEPNPEGSDDAFTYMNFQKDTKRNIAKLKCLHRFHFSAIDSYTVQELEAPRFRDVKDTRINIISSNPSGDEVFFSERSLRVLAENIPVTYIEPLGIQLGIKAIDIGNFRAEGHTGFGMTFRILQEWMKFYKPKEDLERIIDLSKALVELDILNVALVVEEVFSEKRELQRADFHR
ncbi:hypothetical protein ACJMK2_011975, partial [Sinanodonta woodiana]